MDEIMGKFWKIALLVIFLFVVVLLLPHFMPVIKLIGESSNTTVANITASYNATYSTNMTNQPTSTAFEIGFPSIWFWGIVAFIVIAIYLAWKSPADRNGQ